MSEASKLDIRYSLVYLDRDQRTCVGAWLPTHIDVIRFPMVQENVPYTA